MERIGPTEIVRSGNCDADWAIQAGPELVTWLGRDEVKRSIELFHPSTRAFLEFGMRVGLNEYLAVRARRFAYARERDELLGEDTVIATPTLAEPGWLAEGPLPETEDVSPPPSAYNTNVQNITGNPAITVPAGRCENGVPFGLQFTGPRFRDGMLLDLAEAWERAYPWPPVAEGYASFSA